MKFNETKMKQAQEGALKILQESEDKSQAILDVFEKLASVQYEDLIEEIQSQAIRAESDSEYSKKLGLRSLSKEENDFYDSLKDIKQAITADQIDILPTSIVDITLENIRQESGILNDINFTPANVKRWISGDKTGKFAWGTLTSAITGELSTTITGLNIEVHKLSVYLVIPKAIRELALPFIDKYFMAILKESLNDGLEYGYLQGSGKNEPIGIYKQIEATNEDGTHKDKTLNELKNFTPKGISTAKKYLINDGKRVLDKLVLYCHPNDEADYVAPAIYNNEGVLISSYKNLIVKQSVNNPSGKAALVIPKKYTMGLSGFGIKEYDQTKALDDADVVIGKGYSNGRAVDDKIAYVFDVTKLEEYIAPVKVIGTVSTQEVIEGA